MTLDFEVSELYRRLANLIQLGQVIETDYLNEVPRVRVKIGELTTAWLPMMTQRAGCDRSWWPMEIGEQVLILAPGGELSQAVILGALYQQAFPTIAHTADVHQIQYSDGAVVEYDRKSHHLKASLPPGAQTELRSDGGVTIIGDVSVQGHLTVSGEVSDRYRSMQTDRQIFNTHVHAGVQSGSSVSAAPEPKQ